MSGLRQSVDSFRGMSELRHHSRTCDFAGTWAKISLHAASARIILSVRRCAESSRTCSARRQL